MSLVKTLSERAGLLKKELDAAQARVKQLTDELNMANAHVYAVHGHCNEVAYLLGEAQKEAGIFPKDETAESKEQKDGEVESKSEEQASQE